MPEEIWHGVVSGDQPARLVGPGIVELNGVMIREGGPTTLFCSMDGGRRFALGRLRDGATSLRARLHLGASGLKLSCDYDAELLVTGKLERPRVDETSTAKRRRVVEQEPGEGPLALREQQATRSLRQMLQKLMDADVKDLDRTKAEFEQTLTSSLLDCGDQREALQKQTQRFLDLAKQAVAKEREVREKRKGRNDVATAQHPSTVSLSPQKVALASPAKSTKKAKAKAVTPISSRILPSGVTIEVLSLGQSDRQANPGREIQVQYEGRVAGQEGCFDSGSRVFRLGLGEVLRGWDAGIEGMLLGEKRRLHVPARLGYGPKGLPPKIPPNAGLIFEVELLRC